MIQVETVGAYMDRFKHPLKAEMEAVRAIILAANAKVGERVKWNAPSFYYKTDIGAINPRALNYVQLILVFPKGIVTDGAGILMGDISDRREVRFHDLEEVLSKKTALQQMINDWIDLMDS